jgi:superfamily II DNA/RNA helicase
MAGAAAAAGGGGGLPEGEEVLPEANTAVKQVVMVVQGGKQTKLRKLAELLISDGHTGNGSGLDTGKAGDVDKGTEKDKEKDKKRDKKKGKKMADLPPKTLIFCNTKRGCDELAMALGGTVSMGEEEAEEWEEEEEGRWVVDHESPDGFTWSTSGGKGKGGKGKGGKGGKGGGKGGGGKGGGKGGWGAKAIAVPVVATITSGVSVMHAGKMQWERERALELFAQGRECRVLIGTDVAGRGIDVPDIGVVVNFDFPDGVGGRGVEDYVHRIGRTARGTGTTGTAYTLFCAETDKKSAHDLVGMLERAGTEVPPALKALDQGSSGVSCRSIRGRKPTKKNQNWW